MIPGLLKGASDWEDGGNAHAAAHHYDRAVVLDFGGVTERPNYIGKRISYLEQPHLGG